VSEVTLKSACAKKIAMLLTLILLVSCGTSDIHTSSAVYSIAQTDALVETSDISYDGKYTLIADEKSVCLWNNNTKNLQLPCLIGKAKDYIEIVKISKNNQYFITSNRVSVRLYAIKTGLLIGEWSLQDHIINDIALSKKSDVILLGFRSGKVSVINPFTKAMATYQKHKLDINSVTISDDGVWAFTGASDKTAKYWSTLTGKTIHSFDHMTRVNHVALSVDQHIGFSIDAIKDKNIWNLKTGELIAELDSHERFMVFNDSEISPDNSLLLSGSPKKTIQLWRLTDGKLIAEWEAANQRKRTNVLSIAFKGNTLLSSTSDGVLEEWQLPPQSIINQP
jgi:WD40 repeat protein